MAIGDDAANAGMDVLIGTEDRRNGYNEINKSRDYIAQKITAALARLFPGIVGATTPPTAGQVRSAIGAAAAAHSHQALSAGAGRTFGWNESEGGWNTGNRMNVNGVFTVPNAGPATSAPQVAYINSDGRLARGSSSRRYKEQIVDAPDLGDIWPDLREFQMIDGDGHRMVGYIAEELAAHPDQARFVVYTDRDGELVPDSIDFIGLLMAQNAQLHARLAALESRDE